LGRVVPCLAARGQIVAGRVVCVTSIAGNRCSATRRRRDLFLTVLEQVRKRYEFVVAGYVVMPEPFIF
jgi:hypothetical protein